MKKKVGLHIYFSFLLIFLASFNLFSSDEENKSVNLLSLKLLSLDVSQLICGGNKPNKLFFSNQSYSLEPKKRNDVDKFFDELLTILTSYDLELPQRMNVLLELIESNKNSWKTSILQWERRHKDQCRINKEFADYLISDLTWLIENEEQGKSVGFLNIISFSFCRSSYLFPQFNNAFLQLLEKNLKQWSFSSLLNIKPIRDETIMGKLQNEFSFKSQGNWGGFVSWTIPTTIYFMRIQKDISGNLNTQREIAFNLLRIIQRLFEFVSKHDNQDEAFSCIKGVLEFNNVQLFEKFYGAFESFAQLHKDNCTTDEAHECDNCFLIKEMAQILETHEEYGLKHGSFFDIITLQISALLEFYISHPNIKITSINICRKNNKTKKYEPGKIIIRPKGFEFITMDKKGRIKKNKAYSVVDVVGIYFDGDQRIMIEKNNKHKCEILKSKENNLDVEDVAKMLSYYYSKEA